MVNLWQTYQRAQATYEAAPCELSAERAVRSYAAWVEKYHNAPLAAVLVNALRRKYFCDLNSKVSQVA